MRRKTLGTPSKRFAVFKHVGHWDGTQRCEVWELVYESDDKHEAFNFFYGQEAIGGYFEVTDESLTSAKTLVATV